MDQAELAFIDGTHPALVGNSVLPKSPRSKSPITRSSRTLSVSSRSSTSSSPSTPSSPRFSAVDPDPQTSVNPKFNPKASNGGASNTGPKGVIADWKNSQIEVANQHGKNLGGMIKLQTGFQEGSAVFSLDTGMAGSGAGIVGREEEGRDEEERARFAYRERRKDELRGSGEGAGEGKVFGHLREIGIHQFLNAVEDDSGIAVVIHLYEPSFEDCEILNYHLTSIARAYPYTKFLRALAAEMDYATDLEEAALPTLLVYRNGELETSLVGMNRDWGNGTREEILAILVKNQTVSRIPTIPFEGTKGPTLAGRESSGEDSD